MNSISVMRAGQCIAARKGENEAQLLFLGQYQPGDELWFECGGQHAIVSVDAAVLPARVYLPHGRLVYRLPLDGDNPLVYAPGAFAGERHVLSIQPDRGAEYRNLAQNAADQRGDTNAYPHVAANVETRDESVFCARNVLDGLHIANGHGVWPYQSWGIGARTDAEITLTFGRPVRVDAMALYLRADFPHDAYWVEGTVLLSDGYQQTFPLRMLDGEQRVELGEHIVEWMRLLKLVKCDMPSAFPALRQWEVYGQEA
ncbi:MAG: carbohydrate-binding protein [Clostridia bacterium]